MPDTPPLPLGKSADPENAVHGNCGLDDAEIGAYVAAVDRDAIEDSLPDLVGERGKECGIESLDIGGRIDIFE